MHSVAETYLEKQTVKGTHNMTQNLVLLFQYFYWVYSMFPDFDPDALSLDGSFLSWSVGHDQCALSLDDSILDVMVVVYQSFHVEVDLSLDPDALFLDGSFFLGRWVTINAPFIWACCSPSDWFIFALGVLSCSLPTLGRFTLSGARS